MHIGEYRNVSDKFGVTASAIATQLNSLIEEYVYLNIEGGQSIKNSGCYSDCCAPPSLCLRAMDACFAYFGIFLHI